MNEEPDPKELMNEENWFGKEIVINGPVICIEEDEDLKNFGKCAEYVAKMYEEIGRTGISTQNIHDLVKDIENNV